MDFFTLLNNPITAAILLIPLGLIVLDIVTGILSSLKLHTFQLKNVSAFISNDLEKYLVLSIVCFLIFIKNGTDASFTLSTSLGMGTLALSTVHSIIQNVGELGSLSPVEQTILEQGADSWLNTSTQKPTPAVQIPVKTSTPPIQARVQPMPYLPQQAVASAPSQFKTIPAPATSFVAQLTPAQPVYQPPVYQAPAQPAPDYTQQATSPITSVPSVPLVLTPPEVQTATVPVPSFPTGL